MHPGLLKLVQCLLQSAIHTALHCSTARTARTARTAFHSFSNCQLCHVSLYDAEEALTAHDKQAEETFNQHQQASSSLQNRVIHLEKQLSDLGMTQL